MFTYNFAVAQVTSRLSLTAELGLANELVDWDVSREALDSSVVHVHMHVCVCVLSSWNFPGPF